MKRLVLALLTLSSLAHAKTGDIDVRYATVVQLSKVSSSSIGLHVSYPGLLDNPICGIELRLDDAAGPIDKLLDVVSIEGMYSKRSPERQVTVVNPTTIEIALILETYIDGVVVSSQDGSPLNKTIQSALGNSDYPVQLIALAKPCSKP